MPNEPSDLVALQTALWQPLIEWAATDLRAPGWPSATGVLPLCNRGGAGCVTPDGPGDLRPAARGLEHPRPASGSLIIGLAVLDGYLGADGAAEAALLDERWQAARWGVDAEAESRRTEIVEDIRAAALFLLLSGDAGAAHGTPETAAVPPAASASEFPDERR